jgi:hypothetical protein
MFSVTMVRQSSFRFLQKLRIPAFLPPQTISPLSTLPDCTLLQFYQEDKDKMSLSSSSALRISAQVWPSWLPKAVSTTIPRGVTAGAQTSVKAPIQPSTSFPSILTNQDPILRNHPEKLVSCSQPNYQQTRTFSASPPRRSPSQNAKAT